MAEEMPRMTAEAFRSLKVCSAPAAIIALHESLLQVAQRAVPHAGMSIDQALADLMAANKARFAQVDALQALVLALLQEHPAPELVMARFALQLRAEEARLLGDTTSSDEQLADVLTGWQLVQDCAASVLAPPGPAKGQPGRD